MAKVYVITATDQYNTTWVEKIYSSLDIAKSYLLMNYKYWWENRADIDSEEYEESINSIENLNNSDLNGRSFYVDLYHRGIELTLDLIEIFLFPNSHVLLKTLL